MFRYVISSIIVYTRTSFRMKQDEFVSIDVHMHIYIYIYIYIYIVDDQMRHYIYILHQTEFTNPVHTNTHTNTYHHTYIDNMRFITIENVFI